MTMSHCYNVKVGCKRQLAFVKFSILGGISLF